MTIVLKGIKITKARHHLLFFTDTMPDYNTLCPNLLEINIGIFHNNNWKNFHSKCKNDKHKGLPQGRVFCDLPAGRQAGPEAQPCGKFYC